MKNILIIYTGGTIGMVPTSKGYAPKEGYFHEELDAISSLHSEGMPQWTLHEMSPLLDSSNMTVKEWNEIARIIVDNYKDYDGFVVLHGTDTMAYTASALSFMLENLAKPVVLTGAQIPLCELRSDGRDNIITSLLIAADDRVHEVCLYFDGVLMRGNRATKFSSDGLAAFVSPNFPPLAVAGININYRDDALLPKPEEELKLQLLEEVPIGVLKVFPGIRFSIFEAIMKENMRGIVIETFGAGNIPEVTDNQRDVIRRASESGTVITICSQCPQGAVTLGAYESSDALKSVGAGNGYDLTTEAAVAKLYYLFSCGYDTDTIREKMEQNLRGEMTV